MKIITQRKIFAWNQTNKIALFIINLSVKKWQHAKRFVLLDVRRMLALCPLLIKGMVLGVSLSARSQTFILHGWMFCFPYMTLDSVVKSQKGVCRRKSFYLIVSLFHLSPSVCTVSDFIRLIYSFCFQTSHGQIFFNRLLPYFSQCLF